MLEAIWDISYIMSLMSGAMMIILIIRRFFDSKSEQDLQNLKREIRGIVFECSDNFDLIKEYESKVKKHPDILMSIAKNLLPSLGGETKENITYVLEKFGVLNLFVRKLTSFKEGNRSIAIRNIAYFDYSKTQIIIYKTLIQDKSPNVRLDAAVALNSMGKIEDLNFVIKKIYEKGNPSYILFRNFLRKVAPNFMDEIIATSRMENVDMASLAADALGYCNNYEVLPRLIEIIESKKVHTNTKLCAFDALIKLEHPMCEEAVIKCLDDELPEIRAKAALCVGEIVFDKAKEKLISLLNDDDFNVRLNSAVALSKIGDMGIDALKGKINKEKEKIGFFKNMLSVISMVVNRGET
jgi:hypothetical protein